MIYPHSVTIANPGTENDGYGDPGPDWESATLTTSPAWVQQRSTNEVNAGNRRAVVSGWMAFLPSGTPVTAHSRLTWNSITFELDGFPNDLWTPDGSHHIEAQLKVVTG